MQTTMTSTQEAITQRVIQAIEDGQTPPWRRPISDRENDGFPTHPITLKPYQGVDALMMNLSAMEEGFRSKFWGGADEWRYLDSTVSSQATILADGMAVFNADQLVPSLGSAAYRSRRRREPAVVDYAQAEAVIKSSGATIHFRLGREAAYYFPPADYIVFPLKEQFLAGPGGLPGYYDSLFHELAHHTEPRLGWDGPAHIREWRAEIAAPFLASQLGLPVLYDMHKIRNHGKHLGRWVKAMKADPTLIFHVAADASRAVAYLLSLTKAATA
jgi:antirestriction protein ArdC